MISTIYTINCQNSSLVILPSPLTSNACTTLSISAKEGSSTQKALAIRLSRCPNQFFSSTPDLSTSKFLKAALSSFLARVIISSISMFRYFNFQQIIIRNCILRERMPQLKFYCSLVFYILMSISFIFGYIYKNRFDSSMAQKKINGYLIFLNQCLGRGSYGCVYLGQKDDTKKECAVKILQKRLIDHDQYLKAALLSEIQILQSLKSQNIVKVYDVMESSNNYYIIQEICDTDLQKYLKTKHLLEEKQAITFLTQICNGFISLAREGIVHRDIKPANLLMSKGSIKIGDFGFAKKNTSKRMKNATSVGTPLYMPLQILKSQPYTSKCDIWAVGFIFYEMLHGRTPWTANTEYELVKNIENKPIQINPGLSPNTKDFLSKTLKIDEGSRMSWDEVFMHPIFEGYFYKYAEQNKQFQNKLKRVMRDLRFEINSKNIDLNRLLDGLGFKNHSQLNYQEFTEFIKHIHPKILKEEIRFFFQKMDSNIDGSISMKELTIEMEKHKINFNKQEEDNNKGGCGKQSNQITISADLEQKVKRCFFKLNKILTTKHLTLYKTFYAYDTDKNGQLTIIQFEKIMKRLDTSFTDDEIRAVFQIIDSDHSKSIQFDQLNSYYCKVNGLAQGLTVPPQYFAKKNSKDRWQ